MRWEHIATTVLGSDAASVSFATAGLEYYRKFRLLFYLVKDGSGGSLLLRFNDDDGANYDYQRLTAITTTVSGARLTGQTSAGVLNTTNNMAANQQGLMVITVAKPAAGQVARLISHTAYGMGTPGIALNNIAGEWANTSDLINRIDIISPYGNFATGTRALLEGSRN